MTIKVIQRPTCPDSWYIGCQCRMAGEVLELYSIEGDQYTWVNVETLNPKRWIINEMAKEKRSISLQPLADCQAA